MPLPAVQLQGGVNADAFTAGELTFIGTATVLVRVAGFTFLTDPNFLHQGQHAKLGYGLRSRRLTEPAMNVSDLPPLDFVVLSHHHGDHFDDIAAAELPRDVPIITGHHAAGKLRRQGFTRAIALRTWETQRVTRAPAAVDITSLPGKHAPQPLRALLPPVMGSMLDFSRADGPIHRMYVTGDTLFHDELQEIVRRFSSIDLCVIHLGGTRIAGILLTMDAGQGVRALRLLQPRQAVPVHYDDYTVFKSSLEDFRRAIDGAGLDTEMVYLDRGQTHRFALADTSSGG